MPSARDESRNCHYLLDTMKRARPYDRDTALDAALSLFWTKGYHATSLKDLEAALKMRPGSIYAAFSSKQALFLSALERYFHQNRDAFRFMIEEAESPLEALADHLREFGQDQPEDRECRACMLVRTLLDTTSTEAVIAARARRYLDEMKTEIAAAFDRAKSSGELPPDADPDRLARRYQSDITALRIESQRGIDPIELATLADDKARDFERLRVRPN